MKVYAVERCEDDFYAEFELVKLFAKIADARAFCNQQVLAALEEQGVAGPVEIKTQRDTTDEQVYFVVAVQTEQPLKLTQRGEWYRAETRSLSAEYRVVQMEVE